MWIRLLGGLGGLLPVFFLLPNALLCLGVLLIGTEFDGRIVRTSQKEGKSGPYYHVQYAFTLDGRESTHEVYVNPDVFAAVKAGDPVSVRGLPWTTAGHWPRLAGYRPEQGMIACFFLFWLSLFYWKLYWVPLRQRRLVRWGQTAEGTVRSMKTWLEWIDVTYIYWVSHRLLTGRVTLTAAEAKNVHVGDVVTVLYDPRRPRRSLAYRYAQYEVRPPLENQATAGQ